MTQDVSDAFVKQFESEVHMTFQRMGSTIRNTIRTKTGVKGTSTTFQVAGTGTAGSKNRHGQVPIMNASRTPVECTVADRYAGEYIDKLDELKVNHDERDVASKTVAGAMGRDVDDILLEAFDASANSNNNATATTWTAAAAPIAWMEIAGNTPLPFDGRLYFVVCWEAWGDLLDIDEFSNADYVAGDRLWFEGVSAKKWLGFNWYPHERLDLDSGNDKKQFLYHHDAVGHAIGADMSLDISWQGKEQANLAVGRMSHGAVVIDDTGIIEMIYDIT